MDSSLNTNIDNYSIEDLLNILELNGEDITENMIVEKSDMYIKRFNGEENKELSSFFVKIKDKLLKYLYEEGEGEGEGVDEYKNNLTNEWIENEYLTQKTKVQLDKQTDRNNRVKIYEDTHVPMKRETLGVNNTYDVPVAQGVLNPNLKNITTRIINLDSQYRETNVDNEESATDYTLSLSEPLMNVISLKLYSFQIPYSWYVIDSENGNNHFWISFVSNVGVIEKSVLIEIGSGNYTTVQFVNAITESLIGVGFDFSSSINPGVPIEVSAITNRVTLYLSGGKYGTYVVDETTLITFYDYNSFISSNDKPSSTCKNVNLYINETLGWIMGYRESYIFVENDGNKAETNLSLIGSRYFILVVDDLNQNHLNDSLVGITEMSKTIKLPKYYTPTLPYSCRRAQVKADSPNNVTYSMSQEIKPSAPRVLTQAQIYSINEIIKNNEKTLNYKSKSPNVSDTFALIPLKVNGLKQGDIYVDFGGSLQDMRRDYFGPVNLVRLRVRLLDDKGNIVNLNGNDWSITLKCESLYQY